MGIRSTAMALVALGAAAAFAGTAAATPPAGTWLNGPCLFRDGAEDAACSVVVNNVKRFDPQGAGGQMVGQPLSRSIADGKGNWGGTRSADLPFGGVSMNVFSTWDGGALTFRRAAHSAVDGPVTVQVRRKEFRTGPYGIQCDAVQFIACSPASTYLQEALSTPTWSKARSMAPDYAVGVTVLESLPLMVKVVNFTDQPLERTGDVSISGVSRDTAVADPATIAALGADPGIGWYHLFRQATRSSALSVSYRFGDGRGSTALTGNAVDIDIQVEQDGTAGKSRCQAPEGLPVDVSCTVTWLGGDAGPVDNRRLTQHPSTGPLVAVVTIGTGAAIEEKS